MEKTATHNGHSSTLDFLPFDVDETRQKLSDFGEQATAFIREKPGLALLGAFCVGFALSRLVNRR